MEEPKFKVGDWVRMVLPDEVEKESPMDDKIAVHILEINQQVCEAGIEQTSYIGRIWTYGKYKHPICTQQLRAREMELGEKIEPLKTATT